MLGKNRDEGDGQRPLGKKTPKGVGDPKGQEEGISRRPGSKEKGDHYIPEITEYPGKESSSSHHPGGPEDSFLFVGAIKIRLWLFHFGFYSVGTAGSEKVKLKIFPPG
jgi:hypothetical protein